MRGFQVHLDKFLKNTKNKVEALDAKTSALNTKLAQGGHKPDRQLRIPPPAFTPTVAGDSDKIDQFFADLAFHFKVQNIESDEVKNAIFRGTLSTGVDDQTASMRKRSAPL